jgi:NitT/TauT family transport system substrate-binding protein
MLRIAVPDLVSNSYFPIIAAVELGFFNEEGYDASVDLLFPVPKTFAALRDGQLDFVVGSAHATLLAFPQWQGAKLLCAIAKHTYWFLVVRSDLKPKRGDLDIVKGLQIGAAPGVDLSLKQMLAEAGIDTVKDDVRIMPIPGAAGSNVSFGLSAAKALEEGKLDGFWANGMGCEVAVRRGVGTMVLDVRRGDGPPPARHYTFPALVTTDKRIAQEPQSARGAIRAVMKAHKALKENVNLATAVAQKRFSPAEAELIAELIRRDLPYYDPAISTETLANMNRFAQDIGLLSAPVAYEDVVATQFNHLWTEQV